MAISIVTNEDNMAMMSRYPDKYFELAIVIYFAIFYGMVNELNRELQIGKAGEYMVCSDLILKGLVAYPSEQGLPYDVVVDNGKRLLKIQVKSTLAPRIVPQRNKDSHCYIFSVKIHGKNRLKRYTNSDVDVFALVALDTKKVAYILNKDLKSCMNLRVDAFKGTYYDEKGIKNHLLVQQLKSEGLSYNEISEKINLNKSTVHRMMKETYKPFKSSAPYLSDMDKNLEWFKNL